MCTQAVHPGGLQHPGGFQNGWGSAVCLGTHWADMWSFLLIAMALSGLDAHKWLCSSRAKAACFTLLPRSASSDHTLTCRSRKFQGLGFLCAQMAVQPSVARGCLRSSVAAMAQRLQRYPKWLSTAISISFRETEFRDFALQQQHKYP